MAASDHTVPDARDVEHSVGGGGCIGVLWPGRGAWYPAAMAAAVGVAKEAEEEEAYEPARGEARSSATIESA